MSKIKINRVWIEHKVDESPDTSYLGHYTDDLSGIPDDAAIIAIGEHAGELVADFPPSEMPERGRQYRFFVPGNHLPHDPNNWEHVPAKALKDVIKEHGSIAKADEHYAKEDFKRMESLNNGDWCYLGIIAKAEVTVRGVIQTIRSGGLWGIESDSDKKYFAEVEQEQLGELRKQLEEIGLGKRAIDYAFKRVERTTL